MLISLGAVAGANLRYWVGVLFLRYLPAAFPTGTLVINITGSLVLGAFVALEAGRLPESFSSPRLLIAVGFFGAYTTFSAFSLEIFDLINRRSFGLAAVYVVASVMGGVLGLAVGYLAGQALRAA